MECFGRVPLHPQAGRHGLQNQARDERPRRIIVAMMRKPLMPACGIMKSGGAFASHCAPYIVLYRQDSMRIHALQLRPVSAMP